MKEDAIAEAVSRWDFSAHSLDEDELVYAAFLMLAHALQMPELEKWRLPAGKPLFEGPLSPKAARTRELTKPRR